MFTKKDEKARTTLKSGTAEKTSLTVPKSLSYLHSYYFSFVKWITNDIMLSKYSDLIAEATAYDGMPITKTTTITTTTTTTTTTK